MSSEIDVRELAETEAPAWEAFVQSCPQATFFHRIGWRRVIHDSFGQRTYCRVAWRSGSIVGVLPLVYVKSLFFGNSLISMGFCVYGGIAADDAPAVDALARDAADLARNLNVHYLELRHRDPLLPDWPTKSDLYATFRKEIPVDEAANLKMIPKRKRADVRKSLALAPRLEVGDDLDTFYRLFSTGYRDMGTPIFTKKFFANIMQEFGDDAEIAVAYGPDGPAVALMSFFFRDEVLPYFVGNTTASRKLHALDFVCWNLMRRSVERGARLFDFGRSKNGTGPFRFKKLWGFTPEPLHYQYHLVRSTEVPNVSPTNPKYALFIRAWKRLPLTVANRVGPLIARQLG